MSLNVELYEFMMENSWKITEEWFEQLEKTKGVYASDSQEVVDQLKKQNHAFHTQFFSVFYADNDQFKTLLTDWVSEIARDEYHQNTPMHLIIREFANNLNIYLNLLDRFAKENSDDFDKETQLYWTRTMTEAMHQVIGMFTESYDAIAERRNLAQQQTIAELSAPIILLTEHTALLPIVGDIDTYRAKIMLEHTLHQCAEKQVSTLFMDLSGVPIVDTMVAQQIFQLIQGLKLLGIQTVLSGLRPEIAQTAVQLGIRFEEVEIRPSLSHVIREKQIFIN